MREVECKISLTLGQVDWVAKRIQIFFQHIKPSSVVKEDLYFSKNGISTDFRLRISDTSAVVTRKIKAQRGDGIEINEEIEFSVPLESVAMVKQFFTTLDYHPLIRKLKRGQLWRNENLTVELLHVELLGWFLEIEYLLPNSAQQQQIDEVVEQLSYLRTQLGVDSLPLESRYYIDMLQELTTT